MHSAHQSLVEFSYKEIACKLIYNPFTCTISAKVRFIKNNPKNYRFIIPGNIRVETDCFFTKWIVFDCKCIYSSYPFYNKYLKSALNTFLNDLFPVYEEYFDKKKLDRELDYAIFLCYKVVDQIIGDL